MKFLVAGWFSFEQMGASAGDILVRDLVCDWLDEAGRSYEIALASPFPGGVDWRSVDPFSYSHVIFVCGPFGNGWPLNAFLQRFEKCILVGLNLSMLDPLESWNPLHLLWERDSSACHRPDLAFLSRQGLVPLVGILRIDVQPEYGPRDRHKDADAAIHRLTEARPMAVVPIDTRLDSNTTGLRSAAEIESMIARMDVAVSTRLHGLVLAMKHGVPVVAIDSVSGGAKVTRQARAIGWPVVLSIDTLTDEGLQRAFDYCLTAEAKTLASQCRDRAAGILVEVHEQFLSALSVQPRD